MFRVWFVGYFDVIQVYNLVRVLRLFWAQAFRDYSGLSM